MTIQELREKMKVIDNQIAKLKQAKREVKEQLKDAIQASFEAANMVKPGDPIKTLGGETMFYEGFTFDAYQDIICLCHPAKKDGTASKAVRHMTWRDFMEVPKSVKWSMYIAKACDDIMKAGPTGTFLTTD